MVHDPQYRGAGNRGKSKRRLKTTPVLGQSPKHQLGNWPNSLSRARACGSPALLTKPSNEKSGSRHSLRGCHRGLSLAPFDLLKIFQQPPRREPRDRARLPVKARERIFNTRSIGNRLIASSPQIQHSSDTTQGTSPRTIFSSGSCSILADEELCHGEFLLVLAYQSVARNGPQGSVSGLLLVSDFPGEAKATGEIG